MPPQSVRPDANPIAILGEGPFGLLRGGTGRFMAVRLAQYVLLFAAGLVLARALGPEGRGQYAVCLALAGIVGLTFNLSLEYSTARMLARREASFVVLARFLSMAAVVLGLCGFITSVGLGLLLRENLLGGASELAVVLAAATIPVALGALYSGGLLLRTGDLRTYGRVSVVAAGGQFVGISLLASFGQLSPESALAMAAVGFAATAIGMSSGIVRLAGWGAMRPEFSPDVARSALATGLAFHPAGVGLFINLRVGLLIVSLLLDQRETGLYSLGISIAEFVYLATFTVAQVGMATQIREEERIAAYFTKEFVRRSVMIGLMLALLTAAGAYPMVLVLYGDDWSGSVVPIVILSFAAISMTVEGATRTYLMRVLRPIRLVIPAIVGLVLNVGGNFLLIPFLGIAGAAVASLVSYAGFAIVTGLLFERATGLSLRRRQNAGVVASAEPER